MNYKVVTDRIEVRSLTENNKPRYVVNGTAQIANKKQVYQFIKNEDGSTKTLKNIFTPHCIESIKKQSKYTKLFVDANHQLIRDASIKSLTKGKGYTSEELKQLDNMLKGKRLPLAKITDIEIEGDSLDIYTELNPSLRDVDEDHKNYFDSVWYSLENKFLNSISMNFADWKYATDDEGNMVIDDVKVLGFSYEDGASGGADHSITEVAIRALEEGTKEGEMKMKEEELKKEKAELEAEKKKLADEKKTAEEAKAKTEEEAKAEEIKKQEEEQKKIEADIKETTEKAKALEVENAKLKGDLNSAKGVVQLTDPPAAGTPSGADPQNFDDKFYKEKLAEVTKDHDEDFKLRQTGKQPLVDNSMKGFTEMSNLQARADNLTADLNDENAALVRNGRLLDKGPNDIVVERNPRQ